MNYRTSITRKIRLRDEEANRAARSGLYEARQAPKGVNSPAIDGLIKESNELMGEVEDKQVLDSAIVGSAQAAEHYEIARYGTIIAWAEERGHDEIVRLLNTNLNEEKGGKHEAQYRCRPQGRQQEGRKCGLTGRSSQPWSGLWAAPFYSAEGEQHDLLWENCTAIGPLKNLDFPGLQITSPSSFRPAASDQAFSYHSSA